MTQAGGGGKPICSICYEDFKPIVEDLQSISVCGHVFHELCIQQWLEYCPAGKRPTCPVCKQAYTKKDVVRLYFQSAGGTADPTQPFSASRPLSDSEAEAVREDARKLEGKLSVLTSAFESQKKRVEELSEEVTKWKDRANKEETMKDVVRKEKDAINQLLQAKREELSTTSAECLRLRERTLALAKELAALKLATDVNLEEDEVVKLASVGNGTSKADITDVLKRSLVLRNKSYKELMAQCSLLGRSETRALKKLEKAEEKIKKLKARLQESEKPLEEKDNGILRNLKVSRDRLGKCAELEGTVTILDPPHADRFSSEVGYEKPIKDVEKSNDFSCLNALLLSKKKGSDHKFRKVDLVTNKKIDVDINLKKGSHILIDEDDEQFYPNFPNRLSPVSEQHDLCKLHNDSAVQNMNEMLEESPAGKKESSIQEATVGNRCLDASIACLNVKNDLVGEVDAINNSASAAVVLCIDDDFEYEPSLSIRNESLMHNNFNSGTPSFSGGLMGTDGSNKHLGKWCRRGQSTVSPTMYTSTGSGNLIAVGADGRGGRVKVLRTSDQRLEKAEPVPSKKQKCEAKQVGLSKGCLQIEHYFGKKGR